MIKYRTECLWGEGYRVAPEVIAFEVFSLGNTDILSTLANTILKGTTIEKDLLLLEHIVSENSSIENNVDNSTLIFLDMWDKYEKDDDEDAILFFKKVLDFIKIKIGKDIKYCLWLCDTKEDIIKEYDMNHELDEHSFEAYEDSDIILSDLGSGGKLYGYEEFPIPILK